MLLIPHRSGGQAGLQDMVRQSRQEMADLRQDVALLQRENLELRQQAGYWKAQHARAVQRLQDVQGEVERLQGENRKLQDQLFGRKSEKSSSSDRSNSLDGEEEEEEDSPPRKRGQQKDRPGPKRRDYHHLPVQDEVHKVPEEQRVCPQCGEALTPSNTEDSEQIEIEVKAYRDTWGTGLDSYLKWFYEMSVHLHGLLAETGRRSPVRATRSGRRLFVCCRVCSQTPYRSVAICLGIGIGCLRG